MTITEAKRLADLELWEDAWQAITELPPEERTAPPFIRLRLRCAIGLERWETVKELASHLANGSDDDRVAAAKAFVTVAGVATRFRQIESARHLVRSAVEAWPDIREEVIDDPDLSEHLP
ncbi:hypothetical protein OKA05_27550 [Luteolibacter arcticus]|uniref:Uncharacterized protein n=1 Tax=Luteolibacter arcticus TaxID=1581411 RepID=A0ABT3GS29_9BACT|nr:hypothetical protein [Luteolibacter arcticus]MCW1926339.1 hypothetical protein [Luteolibacter arcticus]